MVATRMCDIGIL